MDIGRVFPQSFDVSDTDSEEFKDFHEDFKFTFVVAFLKSVEQQPVSFTKTNFEKVTIAVAIVERRVNVLSGRLFNELQSSLQFSPHELDIVSDLMYEHLSKSNVVIDLTRTSFYRPLQKRFADVAPSHLKEVVSQTLIQLRDLIGEKQFSLTDTRNLWIIKPGASSRGRGIEIHSDINEIV